MLVLKGRISMMFFVSSKLKGLLMPGPFCAGTCLAVQGAKGVEWRGVSGPAAQNGVKETILFAPDPQPKDQDDFGKIKDLLMFCWFFGGSIQRTNLVDFKSFLAHGTASRSFAQPQPILQL